MKEHIGYVYMMMNRANTVIYTGVTSDLKKRVSEHKAESFHIDIAGIRFLIKLKGEGCRQFYVRLKEAFIEFVSNRKKPSQRILITGSCVGRVFNFVQKGKSLKVIVSKKVLKNKKLWRVFLDILIKHLCDSVLSYPNIILLHAAACVKDNKGYLFLGPSKSGKTTVAKLSRGYSVLSDDKVLVKAAGRKYYLFKKPFFSYESKKFKENIKDPILLHKIFLLRKSRLVLFKRVSKPRAFASLFEGSKELNRTPKPDIKKVFNITYGLACSVPAFKMHFKRDSSFWRHIEILNLQNVSKSNRKSA